MRFQGTFARYGTKTGWRGAILRTLLLTDVTDIQTGEVVTTHLWFNLTKGFKVLGELTKGDLIAFDGRVDTYEKGYRGRRYVEGNPPRMDYKITRPTKIIRM